jgi:phosphoenolpyruvate carboxylase
MRRILENPPKDRGYQLENMKERTGWYLHDVRQGVDGLAKIIPEGERLMVRSKLRHLLMELRVTHKTLAESLALFDTTDAERFFRDFDKFATDFGTVYASNVVASTARTHCSDIIDLISQITSTIPERTPGRQEIEELGHSVVVSDDDVIVPVMHSLLEGTRKVIDSIRQSIQDDKQRQAIVEKEQYRAEIQPIYETLRKTLDKMDEAARRF